VDTENCEKTAINVKYTIYRKLNTGDAAKDKILATDICYDAIWAFGGAFSIGSHSGRGKTKFGIKSAGMPDPCLPVDAGNIIQY